MLGRLLPQANSLPAREVVAFIETLGEAQREIRDGLDPRLQLELALVKVTRPQLDHSASALEERLRRLEAGAAATPARAQATKPARAQAARAACSRARRLDPRQRRPPRPRRQPTPPEMPDAAVAPIAGEPPAAELTLERVKRAWELILQRVQASSVSLYAMLRDARPSSTRRRGCSR